MNISKTQMILSYKLYHYNSEVKIEVDIWYFPPLYHPYNLQTKGGGGFVVEGLKNDRFKFIITKWQSEMINLHFYFNGKHKSFQ